MNNQAQTETTALDPEILNAVDEAMSSPKEEAVSPVKSEAEIALKPAEFLFNDAAEKLAQQDRDIAVEKTILRDMEKRRAQLLAVLRIHETAAKHLSELAQIEDLAR